MFLKSSFTASFLVDIRMAALLSLTLLYAATVACYGASGEDPCPADVETCTKKYCDMGNHMMCWRDSPNVIRSGVSEQEIQVIFLFFLFSFVRQAVQYHGIDCSLQVIQAGGYILISICLGFLLSCHRSHPYIS